jgi:lipoyl(octanoyl) transferase
MKWYFINTGASTGRFNMDLDIRLAGNCPPDEAFFRLYRWDPYCISLGANQNITSVDTGKAAFDKIDIVSRPTGGRAILHSEELTYSLIMPVKNISSARGIYYEINLALSEGLKRFDPTLKEVELETEQPDFKKIYQQKEGNICFAVPAKSELKFKGKKLVGSAQRKLENVILQHGSILCGKFHRKITEYLYLTEQESININDEMISRTTEIETITSRPVDYPFLTAAILEGFEHHFHAQFELKDYRDILTDKEETTYHI